MLQLDQNLHRELKRMGKKVGIVSHSSVPRNSAVRAMLPLSKDEGCNELPSPVENSFASQWIFDRVANRHSVLGTFGILGGKDGVFLDVSDA